jgi:putative ABC transport system permease protein
MQTALMGVVAGVLAMPLGLIIARVLIEVTNKRSFGWSMEYILPAEVLVQGLLLSVVAAMIAGLYPGWRMKRQTPAAVLRAE